MKRKVLLSLLLISSLCLISLLGWKYRNINISDISYMFFNLSEKERYKVQLIELEYLLVNKGANIKNITDSSIKEGEQLLERNYNYIQATYNENSTRLSFMNVAKNGQKTSELLKGKFFEIIHVENSKFLCKTNLSPQDISSLSVKLSEICEDVVEVNK